MKARREAYEERLALKAKQQARKAADDKSAQEDIERRNAMERLAAKREEAEARRKAVEAAQRERRHQAEEATRIKQGEYIKKRVEEEEKKRI